MESLSLTYEVHRKQTREEAPEERHMEGLRSALFYGQMCANVILRTALEDEELSACVRDPKTGETLKLPPKFWLPAEWRPNAMMDDAKVLAPPCLIFSDFVSPNDLQQFGPSAAHLHGALRPVFFPSENFEGWFTEKFAEEPAQITKRRSLIGTLTKHAAAHMACQALWDGKRPIMPEKKRQQAIMDWLIKRDWDEKDWISLQTIRRALGDRSTDERS